MEDILSILQTNEEKQIAIANKIKQVRKSKRVSQELLSKMSNVSFGSIKRFECTGEISLFSLLKICSALNINLKIDNPHPVQGKKIDFYNE